MNNSPVSGSTIVSPGKLSRAYRAAEHIKHESMSPNIIHDNQKWMFAVKNAQLRGSYPKDAWLGEVITEKWRAPPSLPQL